MATKQPTRRELKKMVDTLGDLIHYSKAHLGNTASAFWRGKDVYSWGDLNAAIGRAEKLVEERKEAVKTNRLNVMARVNQTKEAFVDGECGCGPSHQGMTHMRAMAKRCLTCDVPMIGTGLADRQKYCSPECRKEAYKKARRNE